MDDHLAEGARRRGDGRVGHSRRARADGTLPARRRSGWVTARAVAGVLTAAVVLGGCTAQAGTPAASATPTGSTTPAPEPTSTPSPTAPEPTGTPTPAPTEPAAPPAPTDPASPPPPAPPVHGATAWGVYLAVMTSEDDPAWVQSGTRLEQLGYEPGYGDVACDQGAAEALGLPENVLVRSVHFTTREDADRFVGLYGPDVLGIAQVTTGCLD